MSSPPLEKLLGALGGVLVLGLLGFLVYQAAAVPDTGPELEAEVTRIEQKDRGLVAHVRITNHGGETAAGVNVAGELRRGNTTLGSAMTTVSYVSPESSARGALVFGADANDAQVTVHIAGYELP